MSILCVHLNFIKKKSTKGHRKTALVEYEVRMEIAGKKGGKNKYPYRPARGKETSPTGTITRTQEEQANTNPLYTEIYHNENTFILMFLTNGAKRCKSYPLDLYLYTPLTLYFHTRNDGHKQKFEKQIGEKQATVSPVDTPYVDKTNWVVNLSSRSLSDAEKALLKKGLNFAVTPANIPATEIIAKVEAAVRQLDAEQADTVRRAVNGIP